MDVCRETKFRPEELDAGNGQIHGATGVELVPQKKLLVGRSRAIYGSLRFSLFGRRQMAALVAAAEHCGIPSSFSS